MTTRALLIGIAVLFLATGTAHIAHAKDIYYVCEPDMNFRHRADLPVVYLNVKNNGKRVMIQPRGQEGHYSAARDYEGKFNFDGGTVDAFVRPDGSRHLQFGSDHYECTPK